VSHQAGAGQPSGSSARTQDRNWSVAAAAVASIVAVFGFLPIVNWIPGGRDAPWYGDVAGGWASGTTIALGIGVVLAIASRRMPLWREGALRGLDRLSPRAESVWIAGVAAVALLAYLVIAQTVFSARPLLVDEIVQVRQARIFASGHLWQPTDAAREFLSTLLMVDVGPRTYGQFPPGGPAMLALGELFRATWVVTPAFAAASVVLFGMLLRDVERRTTVRILALLLFAFAPFVALMAGSHMNHVTCGTWLLLGALGAVRSNTGDGPRPGWAWLGGLGFGIAATIRPGDAAAFALPAAAWWLASAVREPRRWRDALAAAAGVAVPAAVVAWVNWRTTGAPLAFGYQILWGNEVAPGFHATPWGEPHTPALGLELVSLYFLRLQTYLFESPVPSLLPVIGSLVLTRRLTGPDRYLLAGSAGLVAFYFAYWHDGFYLGPRFMYPLAPVLALWAGRLPSLVRERFGPGLAHRTTVFAGATSVMIGAATLLPIRVRQYQNGMLTVRWNVEAAEAAAGVRNSLVFVRESWGAQLVARMWVLGVSRTAAERLYRGVDACALETTISMLERRAAAGPLPPQAASDSLVLLLTDSSAMVPSTPFSRSSGPRYHAGRPYGPRCRERVQEEQAGYTVLESLLLARTNGNVYVRDLHGRNSVMLARYPDRPVYLVSAPPMVGAEPGFSRVDVDSMLADGSVE
jgi:hypothetical protein